MYPQPVYNPYTGETHFGMGAYASPSAIRSFDGLGAAAGTCTLEQTLTDNWHILAFAFGAYFVYRILHHNTRG